MMAHQRIERATRLLLVTAALVMPWTALAQQPSAPPSDEDARTLDLAKKTQNPIADLISLPLQNNLNFGYGAKDAPHSSSTQYVLNIQPVVPVKVAEDWNLITRPIIPVIRQPDLINGGEIWGLADIQLQTYLSPSGTDKVTWGVGPVLQFPSATNSRKLGTQKWSAGPGAVVLTQPGKWVIGALANNLWSFAGDSDREDVNLMTIQPFVDYNFEKGWYVSASPIITANWEAHRSDNTWTVPVGGASAASSGSASCRSTSTCRRSTTSSNPTTTRPPTGPCAFRSSSCSRSESVPCATMARTDQGGET
jgi:hypothetical protein